MAKTTKPVDGLMDEIIAGLESIKGITFNQEIEVVTTGLDLLDGCAGGGFPKGKLLLLAGAPGGGKSTLAGQVIGSFQKTHPNAMGFYIDGEQAMTMSRLQLLGCDPNRTLLISQAITLETVIKTFDHIVKSKLAKKMGDVPWIVVVDSETAIPTEKQLQISDPTKVTGYKARMLSHNIPKMMLDCTAGNVTLLMISQLKDKVKMDAYVQDMAGLKGLGNSIITGGNTMKYMPFMVGIVRPSESIDSEKFGFSGVVSEIKFIKNKLYIPHIKVPIVLDYMKGYSDFWTKMMLVKQAKVIKGSGIGMYLPNLTTKKFRYREMENLYNTDPEWRVAFDEIYTQCKEVILAQPEAEEIKNGLDADMLEDESALVLLADVEEPANPQEASQNEV